MQINRFCRQDTRKLVIDAMPGTSRQIAQRTGKCLATVKSHLLELRPGRAFICRWETDCTTNAVAVYQHGPGTDAARPPTLLAARDRSQEADARERACPLPDVHEPMVRFAMRTQPNSVFHLAGRRA